MVFFELVNLSSGNRVGDYDTEQEALCDVWATIQRSGRRAVDGIGLGSVDDQGQGKIIAEGEELARRAQEANGAAA